MEYMEKLGEGKTMHSFLRTTTVGYAGRIKPSYVKSMAECAQKACIALDGNHSWIDMESGVRMTLLVHPDGTKEDIFDVSKYYDCIDMICEGGLMNHPSELR